MKRNLTDESLGQLVESVKRKLAGLAIPTKTSQLQNDSGYKTTDTTYGAATASAAGLMSAADKVKLDGIEAGAQVNEAVTKESIGLGNVDNTADSAKSVNYANSAGHATNTMNATKASQDGNGNNIAGTYAKKSIYGDTGISIGRKEGTANGSGSVAIGENCTASGTRSWSVGRACQSSCNDSIAEGQETNAAAHAAHTFGHKTTATRNASIAMGQRNAPMTTGTISNKSGHALVIGNGTSDTALSNALSVMFDGTLKAAKTITGSTAADYAEMFEKFYTEFNGEDIVGRFVTLEGNKIRLANESDDYILGIVSGNPFVLGNADCDVWNGMFLRDDFGRLVMEPAPKIEYDGETGKEREVFDKNGNRVYEGERPKLNPEYDPSQTYISRMDRPEWNPVGMLGVLSVVQDGTLQINGYCMCGENGIATACDLPGCGYRVTEIINGRVAKVVFREALPVSVGRKLQKLLENIA